MLLQKSWSSSATPQAENILNSFFESYMRLRADKESTKPYLSLYSYPLVSDLESSGEICKRKMTQKFRDNSELYYLVQDKKASSLRLHAKLPAWMHTSLSDTRFNFFKWNTNETKDNWAHIDNSPDVFTEAPAAELRLHLFHAPTKDTLPINAPLQLTSFKHYRLAELILRAQNPFLSTSFSLCLE